MGSPDTGELQETLARLLEEHGEAAVRRALSLVPLLSLVHDDADFNLDTAARAHEIDGPWGALVLEVPRKRNQPRQAVWFSQSGVNPQLEIIPGGKRKGA